MKRSRWAFLIILVAGTMASCTGEPEAPPGASLRERFPEQAAQILQGSEAFVATEEGFALRAPPGKETRRGMDVVMPRSGAGAIHLRTAEGFETRVREVGATGDVALVEQAAAYRREGGT